MITTYKNLEITFEQDFICLRIDKKLVKAPLSQVSAKLKSADDFQRHFYKVSPSGYGIHWPLIDEDLSVEYLLKTGH